MISMKEIVRRWPRRTILLGLFLLGVMLGIFGVYAVPGMPMWPMILIGLGSLALRFWKPVLVVVTAFALGLIPGMLRGEYFLDQVAHYEPLIGEQVTMVGVISDDVGVNEKRETEFHIGEIRLEDGQKLPSKIRIRTRDSRELGRGDVVQVQGKLYETLGTTRQASMTFADVLLLEKNTSNLEQWRAKFFATVSQIISEPQASLGLGYLVGLRVTIPSQLEENLSATGLTHIVAVSGYNLTVIVAACRRLFAKRSAFQAVAIPGLLIVGFIVVAGYSAPINRAAIITSLSLLAWYYGRIVSPILLLLISGAVTAFITPLYIWGDVSWYLSFLAFFGVLVLGPLITKRMYKDKEPNVPSQILIETLSAQAFAIPYIMFLFGTVSVVAPLANLLVLPPTPLIMLGIFLAGVVGVLLPGLGAIVAVIPYLLLTFQIWLIEFFGNLSWSSYELTISVTTMLGLYALLLLATSILWHKEKQRLKANGTPAKINWNMIQ